MGLTGPVAESELVPGLTFLLARPPAKMYRITRGRSDALALTCQERALKCYRRGTNIYGQDKRICACSLGVGTRNFRGLYRLVAWSLGDIPFTNKQRLARRLTTPTIGRQGRFPNRLAFQSHDSPRSAPHDFPDRFELSSLHTRYCRRFVAGVVSADHRCAAVELQYARSDRLNRHLWLASACKEHTLLYRIPNAPDGYFHVCSLSATPSITVPSQVHPSVMTTGLEDELQVLVTGASGFLGTHIIEALTDRHPRWRISGLDFRPPAKQIRARLHHVFEVDIRSPNAVAKVFASYAPDLVIHSAGMVPAREVRYSTKREDWEAIKAVNYDGTRHILDAAMMAGCRCFLYTSSCMVAMDNLAHDYHNVDENISLSSTKLNYGRSKGMAESYVLDAAHKAKGLVACALRPSTIIGPGDTAVISVMHDLIAKGETNFVIGDGSNMYDFLYISNAVDAHLLAAENLLTSQTAAGHAFFLSNDEPVYFWDFLAHVWAQFGHCPRYRVHIPTVLAWLVAVILGWITWFTGAASTLNAGTVQDGMRTCYSSNIKAREILGYVPKVGLAEGHAVFKSIDQSDKNKAGMEFDTVTRKEVSIIQKVPQADCIVAQYSTSDATSFASKSARDRWPVILVGALRKFYREAELTIRCRLVQSTMSIVPSLKQPTPPRSRRGKKSRRGLHRSNTNCNMIAN
nr:sterol-4-alpha-carboxylate 3-dehydrogenase, decarboxylating [Quercus suber]